MDAAKTFIVQCKEPCVVIPLAEYQALTAANRDAEDEALLAAALASPDADFLPLTDALAEVEAARSHVEG